MDVIKVEKKTTKTIIISTILVIIILIAITTSYQINLKHKQKLFSSMQNKIIDQALKCHNEDNCQENKILLKELYEKKYLETIINPLNDEYLNENSYIEILDLDKGNLVIID